MDLATILTAINAGSVIFHIYLYVKTKKLWSESSYHLALIGICGIFSDYLSSNNRRKELGREHLALLFKAYPKESRMLRETLKDEFKL